jgi:hypothetical protein
MDDNGHNATTANGTERRKGYIFIEIKRWSAVLDGVQLPGKIVGPLRSDRRLDELSEVLFVLLRAQSYIICLALLSSGKVLVH